MKWIQPKHLIIAACVIIAMLLCCGAVSCVTGGPSVGSVDFDHKSSKKKKAKKAKKAPKKKGTTTKKRSLELANGGVYQALAHHRQGHFQTRRNCITCHG